MASADDTTLQRINAITLPGKREHEQRCRRYDTSYDVWRVRDKRADGLPAWRSRIRVPYAQASIDTALVNVVSGIPRCIVKPRRPQDVLSARAMQAVMDYYVQEDHIAEEQVRFAQQALIFGVSIAKNTWAYREEEKLVREWETDPYTGEQVERMTKNTLVLRDSPHFESWSAYDCWWDPNARDVDSASYVLLRSWKTKEELERKRFREDTGEGLYRNLDKLFQTGVSAKRDATAQESFLGNQSFKRKDAFELWEVWEDDRVTVIGNGQIVLRSAPNPYWHGCKPIVIAQTRPDLFEMQGVAETELLRDIQGALHTLQNMTIDHLHLSVMAGFTYRAGQVIDPNALSLRPNFRWAVTDHDDVRPVQMPTLDSNVWIERQRLLGDSERVTGISAYVGGADSSTIDQTTATGVTALQSAANTLLRFKANQIKAKAWQRTFEQWGEMACQFMSEPVWTEIVGTDLIDKIKQAGKQVEDGMERDRGWWQVSPQECVGHYRYHMEGSEESISQQQARTEAVALLNAFTPFVQMGVVNPRTLVEKVAMAYEIQDVDSLMQPPPQPQAPPAPPTGAGQDPMTLQNGTQAPLPVQQAVGMFGR